jgi:hypothetical protein
MPQQEVPAQLLYRMLCLTKTLPPRPEGVASTQTNGTDMGSSLQWPDVDAFEEWHRIEEHTHTIELRVAKVEHGTATLGRSLWTTKHVYRCARQRVGQKADQKTQPEWQHKILRKGTGCHCQIVIKRYPHMPVILGRYEMEHNHDLSADNLVYTRLSDGARQQIMSLLIQKADTCEIVRVLPDIFRLAALMS